MRLNSARPKHNSVFFYRHDLLVWRRDALGLSMQEIVRRTGEQYGTVRKVFMGRATGRKVFPIAKFLGLDWSQVHNLKLKKSEFRLAVLNGNRSKKDAG